MTLQLQDIADIVTSTLREYGPPTFQQIAQELPSYEVMGNWMKKDKVSFQGGRGISRRLMLNYQNVARHKGLYETDNTYLNDVLTEMTVDWVHADTFYVFDKAEVLANRGKSLLTNVLLPRRAQAMLSLIQVLEDKAWSAPSTTETELPYGLPYWIVKNASTGFNGGTPGSHTTVAGVSPTSYPNWKNYTAQYASVAKDDLVRAMRTGHMKMQWKSPLENANEGFRKRAAEDLRVYANSATIIALEELAEDQNDRLGTDLDSMGGRTVFKGHPLVYVPKLDDDSQNPVYFVDHSSFYPVILKGGYLVEEGPAKKANMHNVMETFIDLTYNFICVDRRRQAVFATA